MTVRRLLTLLLLVASMFLVPVPAGAGPRTDAEFVRATNADRRAHGLHALRGSPTLARLAKAQSAAMARRSLQRYGGRCDGRALWHNDISRARHHWVWLGQNVGCGPMLSSGIAASVARIQDAFMASRYHRANVLYRRANLFGVGTYLTPGTIWVTVNFEQTTPGWA
jgi:uncharacterized protein YkwD